jgi:hypothetical protein
MNWKGFGSKPSWPNRGTILAFVWRDGGKPWETCQDSRYPGTPRPEPRALTLLYPVQWCVCSFVCFRSTSSIELQARQGVVLSYIPEITGWFVKLTHINVSCRNKHLFIYQCTSLHLLCVDSAAWISEISLAVPSLHELRGGTMWRP